MRASLTGPELVVSTCTRRLAGAGVRVVADGPATEAVFEWPEAAEAGDELSCSVSWWAPGGPALGSEAAVQARCGLMHLHGRDFGAPRRLGVEVGSVAAGILAAQALVATAIGRRRGCPPLPIRTSVLQAGLLQVSHYIAAATCSEEWVPAPPATEPGPPFASADGYWFEMETLDPEAWKAFWMKLGHPGGADLGRAWTLFRPRYYRGTTSLPPGFHSITQARPLAELADVAAACSVSLCPVRSYEDFLADPGRSNGRPVVQQLSAVRGDAALRPARLPQGLPLSGISVVEATNRMQGPLAGLLLQMLGASVTRVEPPGGDVGRGVPPLADDVGSFFLCFNRGKQTVELDLGTPAGRRDLAERVGAADVFLHNWRPGKPVEWGLGPDDLAAINPGLVYAEASGWNEGSPMTSVIGTDFLVQAYTGLGYGLSPDPEPPFPSRVLLTDFMGALNTCEGILSGLYRRELEGGHGCRVRTSLEAGGTALQAHIVDGVASGVEAGRRRGRPVWGPLDRPLQAADGFLVVSPAGDDDVARLGQVVGVGVGGDAAGIASAIAAAPVASWLERLTDAGLVCAPVTTDLAALPTDPSLAGLFEPLAGPSKAPATPWHFGS